MIHHHHSLLEEEKKQTKKPLIHYSTYLHRQFQQIILFPLHFQQKPAPFRWEKDRNKLIFIKSNPTKSLGSSTLPSFPHAALNKAERAAERYSSFEKQHTPPAVLTSSIQLPNATPNSSR